MIIPEREVRDIIRSRDSSLIASLLRFGLYRNIDSICDAMQSVYPRDRAESLRLIKLADPPRETLWTWPQDCGEIGDAEQTTINIEVHSYSRFANVDFDDWVRYFAGYKNQYVEDMISQHRLLGQGIYHRLERHQEEREQWEEIARVGLRKSKLRTSLLIVVAEVTISECTSPSSCIVWPLGFVSLDDLIPSFRHRGHPWASQKVY